MTRKRLSILVTVLLALVVLVLASCQQEEDEFPDPEYKEGEPLPPAQQRPEVTIRPGQTLIDGQVMLTGDADSIQEVRDRLRSDLELEPLVATEFTFPDGYRRIDDQESDNRQQSLDKRQGAMDPLVGRIQDSSSLQVALFGLPEETTSVSEAIELISAVVLTSELEGKVVAEPNYVTGFDISGSPWGVEGSPWGVEGSPGPGTNPSPDGTYASNEFWLQWALHELPGINLFGDDNGTLLVDRQPLQGRQIGPEGAGVQVAVFDTSPFESPGEYTFPEWGWESSSDPAIPDPLQITVSHFLTLPESNATGSSTVDISDHGFFVSGLIYAVAPSSDIVLLRVLNEQGQGEIQGLIDALNVYRLARLASNGGSLKNTVVNLSLGAHAPDKEELSPDARQQIAEMLAPLGYAVPADGPIPVYALDVMMNLFDAQGASVVAASGNHSAQAATPLPPQYPAAFPTVVGVSASSKDPRQSCYANNGDLMAPGGNGNFGDVDLDGIIDATPTPSAEAEDVCLPTHSACTAEGPNCGFGVVSYTWKEPSRGFAYWVGTSFATPLVSGLAANIIEAGENESLDLEPGDVRDLLDCSVGTSSVVDAVKAIDCLP